MPLKPNNFKYMWYLKVHVSQSLDNTYPTLFLSTHHVHLSSQRYVTTLAHEIGHNWGANHDEMRNNKCVKSDLAGGEYLMWFKANLGILKNNHKFSSCSIDDIYDFIRQLVGFDI